MMYMYVHTHTYMYDYFASTCCVWMDFPLFILCIYLYIYTYIYMYIYDYAYIYWYICIYIHIHTHMITLLPRAAADGRFRYTCSHTHTPREAWHRGVGHVTHTNGSHSCYMTCLTERVRDIYEFVMYMSLVTIWLVWLFLHDSRFTSNNRCIYVCIYTERVRDV